MDRLGTGRLSSYQRVLLGYIGRAGAARACAQGIACGGAVRTDTGGVILLLMVVWIVFTGGSSGRSASGMAAGIWRSGILLTISMSDDPWGARQVSSLGAGTITARSRQ